MSLKNLNSNTEISQITFKETLSHARGHLLLYQAVYFKISNAPYFVDNISECNVMQYGQCILRRRDVNGTGARNNYMK